MALIQLEKGEGFAFNYQPSRIDRNALFALNRCFDRDKISEVRTKYHRAYLNYDNLYEDLLEYQVKKAPRTTDSAYALAYESVRMELQPKSRLVPYTLGAINNHESFPNSKSPGLPYKNQGLSTKRQAIESPGVKKEINIMWHKIGAGMAQTLPDTCCYARAQVCSREKNKIRAVWGYPLAVYLEEARFFYPILEHLTQVAQPRIAYGLEISTGGMSYINTMCRPGAYFFIGDWSKFDKTIPTWLIRDAFSILAQWIDFEHVIDSEKKVWHVRKHRSYRRWKKIVDYFCDTPIQLSDGKRFQKLGGVPSGSCFTNVIDSIINMLVMRTCFYKITGQLPSEDVYLGDDSVVASTTYVSLQDVKSCASKLFGMRLNEDKSYTTRNKNNIHFLGYYNLNGHPYKPIDTTIVSTIYPERPVRSKMETISRMVGQAYSCFDPKDANNFFKAAHLLRKEEDLETKDVEDFIHERPFMFKYLQTLGINPKTVTLPPENGDMYTFRTQPKPTRRVYVNNNTAMNIYHCYDYVIDLLRSGKYRVVSDEEDSGFVSLSDDEEPKVYAK